MTHDAQDATTAQLMVTGVLRTISYLLRDLNAVQTALLHDGGTESYLDFLGIQLTGLHRQLLEAVSQMPFSGRFIPAELDICECAPVRCACADAEPPLLVYRGGAK